MIAPVNGGSVLPSAQQMHQAFLGILPVVERHARIYFRGVFCPASKADCIAETLALSWRWFRSLAARGKDATLFPMALAGYAARAVQAGRRVCGNVCGKDVMNEVAQRKHGFRVERLPTSTRTSLADLYSAARGQQDLDAFEERLADNLQTSVPEQAAFRIDFPTWLRTRTGRDRRIINDMMKNERTLDLARKYRVTPGRISQLRRDYHADWELFCSDRAAAPAPAC